MVSRSNGNSGPYVRVRSLSVSYARGGLLSRERMVVVRKVSFDIERGRCFALVGESGSGKTTVARAMLNLIPIETGTISVGPYTLPGLQRARRSQYCTEVQAVFQDPLLALNPRLTAETQVREPLVIRDVPRPEVADCVRKVAARVGLAPELLRRRPDRLSGGERQRVCIARALTLRPGLLIADEPVSSLDVTVQAQVVDLLMDLKETDGMTLMLVSHDLDLVRFAADRVGVLYAGRLVEVGPARAVCDAPVHPYSRALRAAAPSQIAAAGRGFSAVTPRPAATAGCAYQDNCNLADMKCRFQPPPLIMLDPDHLVACFKTAGGGYR